MIGGPSEGLPFPSGSGIGTSKRTSFVDRSADLLGEAVGP
jgi:hypothetical protein